MRSPLGPVVSVITIILYSLIAGLLFVLGVELVQWTFTYLMGTSLLAFFHEHQGLDAVTALLINQRIMALVFVVGLIVYIYYHLTEEGR